MFQEDDGSVWIDLNGDYYGEVTYQMEYGGVRGRRSGGCSWPPKSWPTTPRPTATPAKS
jgi:hypothetical protein